MYKIQDRIAVAVIRSYNAAEGVGSDKLKE
jgi:hypothetical protein